MTKSNRPEFEFLILESPHNFVRVILETQLGNMSWKYFLGEHQREGVLDHYQLGNITIHLETLKLKKL